jgi:hypothetical protein
VEVEAILAALSQLGDEAQLYVNVASEESALAIVAEARARLARQLGPDATGQSVESIQCRPAYDGNGFVVLTERNPYPELPLWLEKGTKPGQRPNRARTHARPFFYISAELEQVPHLRRVQQGLSACLIEKGLGE